MPERILIGGHLLWFAPQCAVTSTSSYLTWSRFLQAHRVAHYELGPRKFWWYWCGGLKVHDAITVALWLALNVLCVQQRICLELPRLLGIFQPSSLPHNGCPPPCHAVPALEGSFECPVHGLDAPAVLPVLQQQRCSCVCLQPASGSMEGIWLGGTQKWPTSAREHPRHAPQQQPA